MIPTQCITQEQQRLIWALPNTTRLGEVFAGKTVSVLTHAQQEVLAFTEANNKLVVPKLDCQG